MHLIRQSTDQILSPPLRLYAPGMAHGMVHGIRNQHRMFETFCVQVGFLEHRHFVMEAQAPSPARLPTVTQVKPIKFIEIRGGRLEKQSPTRLSPGCLLVITVFNVFCSMSRVGDAWAAKDQVSAVLLEDFVWLHDFVVLARNCSRQLVYMSSFSSFGESLAVLPHAWDMTAPLISIHAAVIGSGISQTVRTDEGCWRYLHRSHWQMS